MGETNIYLEIFGYVGTVLVLCSMLMTSINKLRIVNIAGSVVSMIYSMVVNAWPVVFLNGGMIIINVIQLIRAYRQKSAESNSKGEKIVCISMTETK